jgi:hypothetical protein
MLSLLRVRSYMSGGFGFVDGAEWPHQSRLAT